MPEICTIVCFQADCVTKDACTQTQLHLAVNLEAYVCVVVRVLNLEQVLS